MWTDYNPVLRAHQTYLTQVSCIYTTFTFQVLLERTRKTDETEENPARESIAEIASSNDRGSAGDDQDVMHHLALIQVIIEDIPGATCIRRSSSSDD